MDIQRAFFKGVAVTGIVLISVLIFLSAYYHKSFVLDPVKVWRGANLAFHSLTSKSTHGVTTNASGYDAPDYVAGKLKSGSLDYSSVVMHENNSLQESDAIRNHIAHGDDIQRGLNADLAQLELNREYALAATKTLALSDGNSIGTDAYDALQRQQREVLDAALDDSVNLEDLAVKEGDVSRRVLSKGRPERTISESVLQNVQSETGISPDEINELLNR